MLLLSMLLCYYAASAAAAAAKATAASKGKELDFISIALKAMETLGEVK